MSANNELIELKEDTLQDLVNENQKVVVQYGAGWCGNCRIIKPKFKKLAALHENIKFVYVDAEKLPGSRGLADVSNLPTFAAFSEGKLVNQAQGNKIEIVEGLVNEITSN